MRIKDVMSAPPVTVRAHTPYKEVVDLLVEHRIGGVPVVDDSGSLLGIVTETDLITKAAYGGERHGAMSVVGAVLAGHDHTWLKKASGLEAEKIVTSKVITAEPSEDVHTAARRLLEHRVGRLPVVEDGRLVGIVSRSDLLRPFQRSDEDIAGDLQARLGDPVTFEHGHAVTFSVDHGVVTLSGSVEYPHDLGTLEKMAGDIAGVVKVENGVTANQAEPAFGGVDDLGVRGF